MATSCSGGCSGPHDRWKRGASFLFCSSYFSLILLYLLADLCFPDFPDAGTIDFRNSYYRDHRWFFGLFALLIELIGLRDILFRSVPWISQDNAVKVGVFLIAVVGATSRRPAIHAILAVLGAAAMLIALFTFGLAYGYQGVPDGS